MKVDYNAFEGFEVGGHTETVLCRGRVLVEGERLLAKPGEGKFIKRSGVYLGTKSLKLRYSGGYPDER